MLSPEFYLRAIDFLESTKAYRAADELRSGLERLAWQDPIPGLEDPDASFMDNLKSTPTAEKIERAKEIMTPVKPQGFNSPQAKIYIFPDGSLRKIADNDHTMLSYYGIDPDELPGMGICHWQNRRDRDTHLRSHFNSTPTEAQTQAMYLLEKAHPYEYMQIRFEHEDADGRIRMLGANSVEDYDDTANGLAKGLYDVNRLDDSSERENFPWDYEPLSEDELFYEEHGYLPGEPDPHADDDYDDYDDDDDDEEDDPWDSRIDVDDHETFRGDPRDKDSLAAAYEKKLRSMFKQIDPHKEHPGNNSTSHWVLPNGHVIYIKNRQGKNLYHSTSVDMLHKSLGLSKDQTGYDDDRDPYTHMGRVLDAYRVWVTPNRTYIHGGTRPTAEQLKSIHALHAPNEYGKAEIDVKLPGQNFTQSFSQINDLNQLRREPIQQTNMNELNRNIGLNNAALPYWQAKQRMNLEERYPGPENERFRDMYMKSANTLKRFKRAL